MSRRPGSLRLRLLLGAAVWIAIALMIAGLIVADLFARHVHDRFVTELGHHLDQLAAGLDVDAAGRTVLLRALSDPRFERPLSGLYWQVTAGERVLLRSRSLWDQTLSLPSEGVDDGRAIERQVRGPDRRALFVLQRALLLDEQPEPLQIAVAEDQGALDVAVRAFNRTLALSLAALAVALIAAACVQVTVGLRPLGWLRRELAAIRGGQKRRFTRPMPSEVQPLIDDLNALLDHADQTVERARLQAGNLAHGLKTRLAVLANEAECLAAAPVSHDTGEAAQMIQRQVAAMGRQLDHHMARARAAASRGLPGASVDVADCAEALVRVMRKIHADRDLTIRQQTPAGLAFAGDRQDLEEMLGNLLDNACKWAKHAIVVSASVQAEMFLIAIDDDGNGLTPDQIAVALSPGIRLDETVPGSGLGLAVVRDLVGLYGGALDLDRSPAGGLRAVLRLPAVVEDRKNAPS